MKKRLFAVAENCYGGTSRNTMVFKLLSASLLCVMMLSSALFAGDYSNRFSLFVDALYWQAKEDGLDYAIQNNNGAVRITNGTVKRMDFDNNGGFRIGAAYRTPCDDYVLSAFWTRFHTKGNDCLSTVYPVTLFPVWSNPITSLTSEQNVKTCSKLHIDMLDVRASTLFQGCRVDVIPAIGFLFARINQSFAINMSGAQSNGPTAIVLNDAVVMRNNFKCGGPKIGVNTIWDAACRFSVVGKADVALTYGKFELYQNETVDFSNGVGQAVFLNIPCNNFTTIRPIIDLAVGLRWDRDRRYNDCSIEKRCNFSAEVCWEFYYFFAQNMLMRFVDDITPGANFDIKGDLATQGLTVRFSFGF
jgi:hypothetical protein